jgi:hypothetical protein
MSSVLDLTFAELRYLSAAWSPTDRGALARHLRLPESADELTVEAAGVASLVARRLLDLQKPEPQPADVLRTVLGALLSADAWVDLAATTHGTPHGLHFAIGRDVQLMIVIGGAGIYEFALLEPDLSPGEHLARMVANVLHEVPDGTVLVRGESPTGSMRAGIAVEGSEWIMSDTVHNPNRGERLDRRTALARLTEVTDTVTGVRVG